MMHLPHVEAVAVALDRIQALTGLRPNALTLLLGGPAVNLVDRGLQLRHHVLRRQVDLVDRQFE